MTSNRVLRTKDESRTDGTSLALSQDMNATKKIIIVTGVSGLAAWTLMSGPVVTVQVPAPVVTVQTPAVAVMVGPVPETYVWDGYEYVGMVGSQYYYLAPGNVWVVCDAPRMARWHDWEKGHADWHTHATRNENYRHDAQGHYVPLHDDHGHDQGH
jgi:hypothetical protein